MRTRITAPIGVIVLIMLLSACGAVDGNRTRFVDHSLEAFGDKAVPTLAECYRALRTQDSVDRPGARNLRPVAPLRVSDGQLTGETDNLPLHFTSVELARCDNAVISPMVTVADLNDDGFDDLVKAPNIVYLNNGDATFRTVELPFPNSQEFTLPGFAPVPTFERLPSTPVVLDLDNDGLDEILLAYRGGLGTQVFALFRQLPGSATATAWRQDESFDLGVNLTNQVTPSVQALTALDFDNDGYTDIVAGFFGGHSLTYRNERAGFVTRGVMLLRNDNGRRLVDVSDSVGIPAAVDAGLDLNLYQGSYSRYDQKRVPTHAISTADLDNDGWTDLVVSGDFGTGLILWNERGSRFVLEPGFDFSGHAHMGPALTDVNGDGYLDIFSSQIHSPRVTRATCAGARPCDGASVGNIWLVSDGPRRYRDLAVPSGLLDGGWGWGSTFVDIDNDGHDELVQTAGIPQMISPASAGWLHRNDPVRLWTLERLADSTNPGGVWRELPGAEGLRQGVHTASVASGDFDRDGRVDLVISSAEVRRPFLYLNRGETAGNWLEVIPVRQVGGAVVPVFGARIEVTYQLADGSSKTALRYSGTQSQSYYSNSSAASRFGVGTNATVSIKVRFPDGTTRTLDSQETNQVVTVGP